MISGHNFIGFERKATGEKKLRAFSTVLKENLPGEFAVATEQEIDKAISKATSAFEIYKRISFEERADFLDTIADEIMQLDELVQRAHLESGLPEARITGERGRTVGQLKLFASLLREGSFVEAIIDTALPERKPLPRSDLRRMMYPIGPVAVFAASNFPLAFSTAGGDTASALASGCPVIVKAHSSHLGTNELVATAIIKAAQKCKMPDGVFSSLNGEGSQLGQQLVKHPQIKAVGFTGSFRGGMALLKAAVNEREEPIPVYAEMSSINPVLLLPGKIKENVVDTVAAQISASIALGVGQFCTNPGLLFLLKDQNTEAFVEKLAVALQQVLPATMLNQTICAAYYEGRGQLLSTQGVETVWSGDEGREDYKGSATLAKTAAKNFSENKLLQNEIFGPSSLVVVCENENELKTALQSLHGQLTATVMGTDDDLKKFQSCIDLLIARSGRLIYNGVPTGVEVSHAMMHGGPFPATTFSHFTSVGTEAIKRFLRPVCFQDCPQEFLPDALKDENPLHIMRKLNGEFTRDAVAQLETVS
jgi:alpha-ketoglutaric semialdehyde dehydrogenase